MDYYEFDEYEINENDIEFRPEEIGPPADLREWVESVITEYIYMTGKTLVFSPSRIQLVQGLSYNNFSPVDAALYLVETEN